MFGEWFKRGKNNEPQGESGEPNPWDSLKDVKSEATQIGKPDTIAEDAQIGGSDTTTEDARIDEQDTSKLKVMKDPGYDSPERAAELDAAKNMEINSSANMIEFAGIKMGLIGDVAYFYGHDTENDYLIEDYEGRRQAFTFLAGKAAELDGINAEHLYSEQNISEAEKAHRVDGVSGKYSKTPNIYEYLCTTYNIEPDGEDYPYTIYNNDPSEIARRKEKYENLQEIFNIDTSYEEYMSLDAGEARIEIYSKLDLVRELAKDIVKSLYEEQARRRKEGGELNLEQGTTYWVDYSPEEVERARQERERQAAREALEQEKQAAFAQSVEKYKSMEPSELDAEIQHLEESLRAARQARWEQA